MIKLFDIECDAAMQNNNDDDESFEARGTETRINVSPHTRTHWHNLSISVWREERNHERDENNRF